MKNCVLLILLLSSGLLFSQSLVETVNIPSGTVFNSAYGLVNANGKYWITSDNSAGAKKIYGLNNSGVLTDEITINYLTMKQSQGLAFQDSVFWYVERKTSRCDLFKVTTAGVVIDSILPASINGGTTWFIGGAAWDGTGLWVTVYSPNTMAGAVKIDVNNKQILDTILLPSPQAQPTGITVKGDTLFIVNDGFEGADRIHAYNRITGEPLYTFNPPERPGQRQNPRGLAWDGNHFWLMAEPVGASSGRQLFKYDLSGNGTPGIYVVNTSLNYGNVQIDSSLTLFSTITNYGTADLRLDSVMKGSNVYQVLNQFPVIIKKDSSIQFQIKFTPLANSTYNDSIKIYHNFVAVPLSKIAVTGKGVFTSSYINFSPGTLSYGDKRINSTSYIEVVMTNLGSQLLTVDSVVINNPNFSIKDFTGPVQIDSLNPGYFKVWFNPTALQTYQDLVTVYSNAGNGLVKTLPVSGTGVTFQPVIGNILWQGNIPPNPKTSYNDLQVQAIQKIEDINGDGIEDVIVCTENYWVIAFNGNSSGSSDILWKFNTYIGTNAGSIDYVQNLQIADMNADGFDDVVVGTTGGNESVYAINGRNGEMLWEFGLTTYDDGDIMGIDVKRDWNNDGTPDVLATASGNESTGLGRYSVYLLNGINGQEIWRIDQSAQHKLKYDVTSTSLGGAFGTRVGTAYEVVGFNQQGVITWSYPAANTPWRLGEIQDINNDGHTDIIVGNWGSNPVVALSSDAGIPIWTRSIGNVIVEDLRVIKDINGNGVQDILISGIAPYVYLLEGKTGEIIWNQSVGGNILGIGSLPDMTGDAIPEAGVADLADVVTIMNGATGSPIFTYAFGGGSTAYAAEMVSALGEIDGVGVGDFIAGSRHGKVVAFSGGADGIIPVEMTSFTASVNGNEVILNWSAATELNNKGFNIERRAEGLSFAGISFIDGKGTTSEKTAYSFTDKNLPYGTYYYRLQQVDFDGTSTYSKEVKVEVGLPLQYSLEQNYPNPFNPSTTIRYALPFDGVTKLKIYNSVGEEIITLVNDLQKAGNYTIEWNGRNSQNISVPSGVYFYRIETDNFSSSRKMLMLK
jgi:hypothetical protein